MSACLTTTKRTWVRYQNNHLGHFLNRLGVEEVHPDLWVQSDSCLTERYHIHLKNATWKEHNTNHVIPSCHLLINCIKPSLPVVSLAYINHGLVNFKIIRIIYLSIVIFCIWFKFENIKVWNIKRTRYLNQHFTNKTYY